MHPLNHRRQKELLVTSHPHSYFSFCVSACYVFALWFLSFFLLLLSSFYISSPNLSGRRLDVYHTSTHGVALVRI